jgi:ATP-dependent Lon protease
LAKQTNRFSFVKGRAKLGAAVRGRDETAVIKTIAAFLKLLHPGSEPTESEFNEYLEYALESRRRVKEQLKKRKPDDEFAAIDFSYLTADGTEKIVYCPESKVVSEASIQTTAMLLPATVPEATSPTTASQNEPKERHFIIHYGDTGYSYESILRPYLDGAKTVEVQDPYIRAPHQIANFIRFCELLVKVGSAERIILRTGADDQSQEVESSERLDALVEDIKERGVSLSVR